jgi:hypothetical protein
MLAGTIGGSGASRRDSPSCGAPVGAFEAAVAAGHLRAIATRFEPPTLRSNDAEHPGALE